MRCASCIREKTKGAAATVTAKTPHGKNDYTMKRKVLLILCSVILLAAGWLRITGLTLLAALVPLLLISRSYGPSRRDFWRMAGWTALTFTLWSVATIWWVWNAAPVGVFAATIVQVVLFGGVFMIYHYVSKRSAEPLSFVVLVCGWLAAEYIYLNGQISFPWLLLGNGFANDTWAIQWYEYTGVLGGSLWVLVSNLLLYKALTVRNRRWWIREAAWVAIPLIISGVIYLSWEEPASRTVKVTAVQPNIEPYTEKFVMPQSEQDAIMLSLAAQTPADVDFILLPETAVDDNIWEHNLVGSPSVRRYIEFIRTQRPSAQFIAGATTLKHYADESEASVTARESYDGTWWYDVYNSALAIDSTGRVAVHHKAKLVIGTEMMPFMNILKPISKFIIDLGGTTGQLGTDNYYRIFRLRTADGTTVSSAAPICYESVYGEHFATFAARGAQVIFVVTNDGWWGDTPGYKQHFSFSRMRAIETRRYIGRSANTGISGFINPRGDVLQTLGWDVRGIITRELPLSDKVTFYAAYGDYLGRIGGYVFLLSILYFVVYRFRKRSHIVE